MVTWLAEQRLAVVEAMSACNGMCSVYFGKKYGKQLTVFLLDVPLSFALKERLDYVLELGALWYKRIGQLKLAQNIKWPQAMIALASYSVGRQQVHSNEAIPPSDFLDSVQGGFLKVGDIESMLSHGEDAGFRDEVEDDELQWPSQCHEDQAEDDQINDYIADALVGSDLGVWMVVTSEEVGLE